MRRAIAGLAAIALLTSGCAPDPPSAVVALAATGCRPHAATGSGMFVDVNGVGEPLVLTSAHVVAGAREIAVTWAGVTTTGTVVALDPDMDLAYIAVDGLVASHPWTVDSSATEGGERATVYVVRDGEVVALPSVIGRRVQIRTEDIYVEGETLRPGYELSARIQEGDSGGAVVVDGRVVGVTWARSRNADGRAYAIDPVRAGATIRGQLETGDLSGVDLTRCP